MCTISGRRRRCSGVRASRAHSHLALRFLNGRRVVLQAEAKMAAGSFSAVANTSTNNEGILIGDKLYSEVSLTIDNSLIPEERLSPTPSMLDGLDLQTETDLRILGCELIQSAGILLRLPQVCLNNQTIVCSPWYNFSFILNNAVSGIVR